MRISLFAGGGRGDGAGGIARTGRESARNPPAHIDDLELEMIASADISISKRIEENTEHIRKVMNYLEKYQFNLGAESIREFFWHTFCDRWIEEIKTEIKDAKIGSKERIEKLAELLYLLKENLKIMHPFIPFVTEAVWQELVKLELANGLLFVQQIGK